MNVYEYGRGGKCVYMFIHTYAGIRIINIRIEKEDRHMSRVMRITRSPCQKKCIEFAGKEEREQKVVMNTEANTNHAAFATQVEKKSYTHDTDL